MPQQETERFSEAIHPLYHSANKPQSDFRETSLEQHHPSAVLLPGCCGSGMLRVAGALSRKTTDHLPEKQPRVSVSARGTLLWLWFGWRGDHALLQAVHGCHLRDPDIKTKHPYFLK